jgi:hypothetical protein
MEIEKKEVQEESVHFGKFNSNCVSIQSFCSPKLRRTPMA